MPPWGVEGQMQLLELPWWLYKVRDLLHKCLPTYLKVASMHKTTIFKTAPLKYNTIMVPTNDDFAIRRWINFYCFYYFATQNKLQLE